MNHGMRRMKRLARRTVEASRQSAASAVDLLRHGERSVLYTPHAGLRLGNLLYLWLQAHRRSAESGPVAVLESRGMAEWWGQFPALRPLSVTRHELRFSDRREWDSTWLYQRYGVDFTREQLQAFVVDVFGDRLYSVTEERLVINVRRGDFYATEFEAKHGFEIVPYVTAALEFFPDAAGALVVSDDPDWCRAELGDVIAHVIHDIEYAAPHPLHNLAALASARQLIGANSTFSYWGAYIADTLHTDVRVVMPRFHARMAHGSDAHQLDPRWVALDGFH